jgi:hypothetical protein
MAKDKTQQRVSCFIQGGATRPASPSQEFRFWKVFERFKFVIFTSVIEHRL